MTKKQQHALIVGTAGVGATAARSFSRAGLAVSVLTAPQAAARNIAGTKHWPVDTRDGPALRAALKDIIGNRGKVSSIVFFPSAPSRKADWAAEIEATIAVVKTVIETLAVDFSLKDCSIVVVTPFDRRFVAPANAGLGYHIAQAGLSQMVRYFAVKLGPRNIRVNTVTHGMLFNSSPPPQSTKEGALLKRLAAATPLGRAVSAKDVVDVVDFLCGDLSSFVTGQDIVIDGGLSLQYQEEMASGFGRGM